jgi:hypothetical protein
MVSVRWVLALVLLLGGVCVGQSDPPELVFFGSDGTMDPRRDFKAGLTYYGQSHDGCTLTPGIDAPSMCWGPRSLHARVVMSACDRLLDRHGRMIDTDAFLTEEIGDELEYWGRGMQTLSGLGMNINLELGATPPTLPPRSFDPAAAGSALVPAQPASDGRPVARWRRPMLGETVDLVTGIPMVQEVDFELPFGSAVYRHVRTYSEPPPGKHEIQCYDESLNALRASGDTDLGGVDGMFYDRHGQGWMIGEAPLFLIDAHYYHVVKEEEGDPRRCYFVLNAHQSIPFDFDGAGNYLAPPHLDAFLEHNGVWQGGSEPGWVERPTVFRVWLHGQSVCYTIRAIYEDVWPGMPVPEGYTSEWRAGSDSGSCENIPWPVTDHESPNIVTDGLPGHEVFLNCGANGVPYWGVVERIDDRYGNCIDLHYCAFRTYRVPDADLGHVVNVGGEEWSYTCHACCQSCHE